jgi:hypothetical protein
MFRTSAFLLAFSLLAAPAVAVTPEKPADVEAKADPRKIDLVLALDTSNSMDGLINSAKARLWDVVNELSRAKPTPQLRVALYTYGDDRHSKESGWVKKEAAFTSDLDALYKVLSGLTTNGGTEYVARVTKAAAGELDWDDSKDTLKILFVAGNESATQDPENDALAIAKATVSKGIVVNTIYCGAESHADAKGYAAIAKAADGRFAVIDQDKGVRIASTPFDTKLAELSGKLNHTYVAYGRSGKAKAAEQKAADSSAESMGAGVAASRAATKSGALYQSGEWDMVDAKKNGKDLAKMDKEELPAEMQSMTPAEREAHVATKAKERETIQKEIAKLSAEREKFIQEETKKQQAKGGADSLDQVLKKSIRAQAEEKGFTFAENK